MKNIQNHSVSLIATDSVSIWEYREKVTVTFRESQESTVEVQGIEDEEFLKAVSYYIHRLTRTDDLSNNKKTTLNSILEDLKIMENNKAPEVVA